MINIEKVIDIWKSTLGLDDVSLDESFFLNGGDSLLVVRFVAMCRENNINISVKDVYEHQTINNIIKKTKQMYEEKKYSTVDTKIHELLPTQKRWLSHDIKDFNHFNLGGIFYAPESFNLQQLETIVSIILGKQPSLRTAYNKSNKEWKAEIKPINPNKVIIKSKYDDYTNLMEDIKVECLNGHKSMDILKGEVFKVIHFPIKGEEGRLLVLVHHLCLDGFSVNILADEIEKALNQPNDSITDIPAPASQYVEEINTWLKSITAEDDAKLWLSLPWRDLKDLKTDNRGDGLLPSILTHSIEIEELFTSKLKSIAKKNNLSVSDLLLGCALKAISEWSGNSTLGADVYYHGRDITPNDIDISKSIGYYLNTYPVIMNFDLNDDNFLGRSIMNQLSIIPKRKFGFDALRFSKSNSDVNWREIKTLPIRFNFRGHMKRVIQRENHTIRPTSEIELLGSNRSIKQTEKYLLMLEGDILDNKLIFSIKHSSDYYKAETITYLLKRTKEVIISNFCKEGVEYEN